ncbi:hypothetical protein BVRB_1g003420 [Beta vulgaris subsp. vulgaris]|nr:hypothetical protein BVRB_1g003420 [Beta vulgaris subsp. vulgaris]
MAGLQFKFDVKLIIFGLLLIFISSDFATARMGEVSRRMIFEWPWEGCLEEG